MRGPLILLSVVLTAALIALPGCGGDDDGDAAPDPKTDPTDAAAKPPTGYHTVSNKVSGFTVSVPDSWREGAPLEGQTKLGSPDGLTVVTVAADRSKAGRETTATKYAELSLASLKGFRTDGKVTRVAGSPYETASIEGTGKVATDKQLQRITAAIYRRPGRATYGVLVFRNAKVKPTAHDKQVDVLLKSLRMQAPSASI